MNRQVSTNCAGMVKSPMKISVISTWIVFIFAMLLGLCGTFLNDLYRDNSFVKAVWRGNDIVTFAV